MKTLNAGLGIWLLCLGLSHSGSRGFEDALRVSVDDCVNIAIENHFSGGGIFGLFHPSRRDAVFRVQEACWNLAKAEKVKRIYEKALERLEEEKAEADRLLEKDAISPEEYLGVAARQAQFKNRVESAKADEELRFWQWIQALGLKSAPRYRLDPDFNILPDQEIDPDLALGQGPVREAHACFIKSRADLAIAETKLALALMELSAAEEVSVSERADAVADCAQAQAALAETQASYLLSLSSLARAAGKKIDQVWKKN